MHAYRVVRHQHKNKQQAIKHQSCILAKQLLLLGLDNVFLDFLGLQLAIRPPLPLESGVAALSTPLVQS